MLRVAKVRLLSCLDTQTDNNETKYTVLQYMDRTSVLVGVVEERVLVYLRWNIAQEQDHSAIARERMNNRLESNVSEPSGVKLLRTVCTVLLMVMGNYGILLSNKSLPWPYHCFYVNRLCRDE